MQRILTAFYTRPLVSYLIMVLILLSAAAGPAEAMLVPAPAGAHAALPAAATGSRAADLAAVQKSLESAELRQRLLDYGLTSEETEARIASLSDEQLHRLATNLDSVQAGGDALGALLTLVVIAALVVLIIYILEGRIEIRKT
jgi:hypothetical protein